MKTLSSQHCVPCKKGTKPLPKDKARAMLKELDGWRISQCGCWLRKSYTFKNFVTALAFVNEVGKVAEKEQHHPDLKLGWGYTDISLQTHAAGGLHDNDFVMAAKIDAL